jgi:lipopolysaccharide export system protein LptC
MTRQGRLAALFAVLAAASWWLLRGVPGPPGEHLRARAPNHIVWDFDAVETNPAGRLDRRLVAAELRQYAAEDLSELDHPHLTLFDRDGGPPWEVRSRIGVLRARGEEVELREQVRIDRDAGAANRSFALATELLRVWPKREYAQGDLPVRLASDQDWLTAAGMRLWYASPSRAEFPGRAHIFLAPAPAASEPQSQAEP